MLDKPWILIAGTESSPGMDETYNEWYNGTHIPMMLESKWAKGVTRYKLVPIIEGDYPKYLAIYDFDDRHAFEAWGTSPELAAARADRVAKWSDDDFVTKWRALYEPIKTWHNVELQNKPVIFITGNQCPPELEEKFNIWYDDTHIPMLLESRYLAGVTRYRLADPVEAKVHPMEAIDYPNYLTIYEFGDRQSLEAWFSGPEVLASREERKETWADRNFDSKWMVAYEPMKTWHK